MEGYRSGTTTYEVCYAKLHFFVKSDGLFVGVRTARACHGADAIRQRCADIVG